MARSTFCTTRRSSRTAAEALASEFVDSGARAAGIQLVVSVGSTTLCNAALGIAAPSRPMGQDTVQSLFCLTKPLVAVAVGTTAAAYGWDFDTDVRDASPRVASMVGDRGMTLRDLMSHRAGLADVRAAEVMFGTRAHRALACGTTAFAHDLRPGVDRVYSEFQAWNVLRCWLEDVWDAPLRDCMRAVVLDHLDDSDLYFGIHDSAWPELSSRLGVHYDVTGDSPRPLLHELLRKHMDDVALQTVGGYGTARALAAFYRRTLRVTQGAGAPGFPPPAQMRTMVAPTAPAAPDPVLSSVVSFGLGFMTDLALSFGSVIGPRAFGHIGLLGGSFAFADPDADLVVAYVANGFIPNDDERQATRAALVEAIYLDVADAA